MLLTAIRTDRHFHPCIEEAKIALITYHLYPFIDEIEIDIDASAQRSLSQLNNCLNAGVSRGCG